MRHFAMPALILSLFAVPVAALAAGQMKAGLWEMTIKSDAIRQMPKISPEQMAQMRKLGINIPQMTNDGIVTKVCISRQMAERDQPPVMSHQESGCETRNYQRSGSTYSLDMVCNGALKGEGKAKGTFAGGDSFTSTYDFKGSMQGRPVSQHQQTSGKWLGADCGDIKPVDQLMPAK